MIYILSLSLIISLIFGVSYFYKYINLKNRFAKLLKPLRTGYYIESCEQTTRVGVKFDFNGYVYINEIDRYTNGESKISLNRIEIRSDGSINMSDADSFVRNRFVSVVKTSDITWLESEQSIKDMRKEKLEQLNKLFKK